MISVSSLLLDFLRYGLPVLVGILSMPAAIVVGRRGSRAAGVVIALGGLVLLSAAIVLVFIVSPANLEWRVGTGSHEFSDGRQLLGFISLWVAAPITAACWCAAFFMLPNKPFQPIAREDARSG
jgi:hypothetical protein